MDSKLAARSQCTATRRRRLAAPQPCGGRGGRGTLGWRLPACSLRLPIPAGQQDDVADSGCFTHSGCYESSSSRGSSSSSRPHTLPTHLVAGEQDDVADLKQLHRQRRVLVGACGM